MRNDGNGAQFIKRRKIFISYKICDFRNFLVTADTSFLRRSMICCAAPPFLISNFSFLILTLNLFLQFHFFKIRIGLLQVFFGIDADILCLHLDDTDLVAHLESTELL